jgi:hypothetical protein
MPKTKRQTEKKKPRTKRWNWTPKRIEKHTPAQPQAADAEALARRLAKKQPEQPQR